MDDESMDEED